MPGPIKKFYGSLTLSELKAAIVAAQENDNLSEFKGEKQLKIGAAQWEDGNISLDAYDKVTKKSFKLGNLRVSQFDDNNSGQAAQSNPMAPKADDLPF